MRSTILFAALSLASCAGSPLVHVPQQEREAIVMIAGERYPKPRVVLDGQSHRLTALLGVRSIGDSEVWDPVADELTAGLQYSKVGLGGFGVEMGVLGSSGSKDGVSSNVDVTGAALELFGGLRKEFDWGHWRPAIGGGAALIGAAIDNDSGGGAADDEDTTTGLYFHGGLFYDFDSGTFLGLDFRKMTSTELEFGAIRTDVDYQQLTLVLGIRF